MNKGILKRHERQVSRGKEGVRLSEPDLRTPEQLTAQAKQVALWPAGEPDQRPHYSTPSPNRAGPAATVEGKADGALCSAPL